MAQVALLIIGVALFLVAAISKAAKEDLDKTV
jgi:hypothetical protein